MDIRLLTLSNLPLVTSITANVSAVFSESELAPHRLLVQKPAGSVAAEIALLWLRRSERDLIGPSWVTSFGQSVNTGSEIELARPGINLFGDPHF